MYLTWKLPTLQIGVKCCWLTTGFWPHFSPIVPAHGCTEVVAMACCGWWAKGVTGESSWSDLGVTVRRARGGDGSVCGAVPASTRLLRPRMPAGGRGCSGTCVKWEHRVCLPQSWLIFRHCWNRWLLCIHCCRFFSSYVMFRFLFHFLTLRSGSVPNSSNVVNTVWEFQSLLSLAGKIVKEALCEPQPGSSPREEVGGALFVDGAQMECTLIKFQDSRNGELIP